MITSLLLAGLVAAGPASGFGMTGSPAAIDNAQAHHSYSIVVTDTGTRPMDVTASLSLATEQAGHCHVALRANQSPSWATLHGPSHYRIKPGHHIRVRVHVRTPPPGHSELIAAFVASSGGHAQVSTSAGVGTALRFSQPGHAAVPPCNHLATPAAANSGLSVGLLAGVGAVVLLILAGLAFLVARLRQRGTHTGA